MQLNSKNYLKLRLIESLEEAEELGDKIHVNDRLNRWVSLEREQSSEPNRREYLEDIVVLVDQLVQFGEVADLEML